MSSKTKRISRWVAAPIGALAAVSLLASCSAGVESAKDNVIFALKEDPTCLDPQQTTVTTALNVGRQVVDSLVDQDVETGEIVPWLAESFESNSDLTAYTFTLKEGVTFSDDTALTSDVVKANFDALYDMGSAASLASQYLSGYDSVEVADDQTFTVTFSQPNAQFLQGATTMTLGLVSEATTELTPEERCQSVLGAGPFVYQSYVPNDSVVIEKRVGYDWASSLREHSGEALVDTIEFPIIVENGVRTGGLDSGEFDIIQDLPYADEARFTTDDFNVYSKANPGIPNSLIPNTSRPIVSDIAVRTAMLLGTDRAEINDVAGATSGVPATSALTSTTPGFASQAEAMEYDPKAAEAMLESAGWTMGADGIREKDGTKLSVAVTAFYAQDVLESTQMQLKKIGIDLTLNMVTAGDFFTAIATGDYDFLGAALSRTDPDALRVLFSTESQARWAIVDDAELESVLAEQVTTADPEARATLVAEAQQIIMDKAYLIPTLETVQLHASRANVEGLTFDSASRVLLYDVHVAK